VEDPVNLAAYIESKMGALELEELRKKNKDKARAAAEIMRRSKLDAEREKQAAKQEKKVKAEVEKELGRRAALYEMRDR
jgi:hypothetical protein